MKIIDCFTFYNEFDMLNYRLNLLFPYVDQFIIVESPQTHIGKEKPLFYKENMANYTQFASKIIHVVKHLPFKYPCNIEKQEQWENEKAQRNAISNGLEYLKLENEDIIILSDMDEIPNPSILTLLSNNPTTAFEIIGLQQDFYYYNLTCKFKHFWHHLKIMKYGWYKQSGYTLSELRGFDPQIVCEDGGWHLSNFGDAEFISNKLKNFGHQEYNLQEFTDTSKIEERIKNSKDLFDRFDHTFEIIPIEKNTRLPPLYEKYLTKFI
jgi:beta-1,4-mannosyl-glycoprotein beta-1,4-N-acetylglucosaminyltransferase